MTAEPVESPDDATEAAEELEGPGPSPTRTALPARCDGIVFFVTAVARWLEAAVSAPEVTVTVSPPFLPPVGKLWMWTCSVSGFQM